MQKIEKKALSLVVLFLAFGFFFACLGGHDLTAPDEPRFALVAKEMLTDSHWVLPHRNGIPYPDKPPLFFWAIAAFSALAGGTVNAWTARLPSAFAASLILLLMWWFSREKESRPFLPVLTILVLMSCAKFFFQARIAQIDMVLCLWTTLALITGYHAMTGKPYSSFWLGMFLGLGILTKGPVGYLVPIGVMALFAAINGRETWRRYPVKALLWGLLPVLFWLILLLIDVFVHHQWDYLVNLLFKQTLVRYFDPWHHHQPFYYFFVSILHDFLPWTLFLLLAVPVTKKKWRSLDDKQKYCWAVLAFTLFFFSLSKGKRNIYILPLFPFAAYLAAVQIETLLTKTQKTWREIMPGVFMGLIFLITSGALVAVGAGWIKIPRGVVDAPIPGIWMTTAGIFLAASAAAVFFFSLKMKAMEMTASATAAMLILCLLFFGVVLPWLNPFRSAKGFMEKINRIIGSGSENPVVGMVDFRAEYRFYGDFPLVELADELGRPRPDLPKIKSFFEKNPNGWLIVREKDWERFAQPHGFGIKILHMQKVGDGKNMMLIRKSEE